MVLFAQHDSHPLGEFLIQLRPLDRNMNLPQADADYQRQVKAGSLGVGAAVCTLENDHNLEGFSCPVRSVLSQLRQSCSPLEVSL
jgi:hypothetical protein